MTNYSSNDELNAKLSYKKPKEKIEVARSLCFGYMSFADTLDLQRLLYRFFWFPWLAYYLFMGDLFSVTYINIFIEPIRIAWFDPSILFLSYDDYNVIFSPDTAYFYNGLKAAILHPIDNGPEFVMEWTSRAFHRFIEQL